MEKQMTALMQSIQRKKDKLAECDRLFSKDKHNTYLEGQIRILLEEIAEDEKLLPVERQQIEDDFSISQVKGYRAAKGEIKAINPEDYYKNKYEDHDKA